MSAVLTFDGFEMPASFSDLDAFRAWARTLGEDAPRIHFSRGNVWIAMSPQDYFSHLELTTQLTVALGGLANTSNLGEYRGDGGWVTNPIVGLSTEPDGFLVLWSTLLAGEARYVPRKKKEGSVELVGRTDMVLEVVSDDSVKKDTVDLVRDYAAAGFREYWIIDARREPLSFRLLVLQDDGSFLEQAPDAEGWRASHVWSRAFRIERWINPAGHPSWRVHSR